MGDKSTTDAPEGETSDSPAAAKDIVQRYRFRVRMADGRELVSRVATVTRPAPVTQARIDPHVACAQPSGMEGDALPVELSLELDTPAVLPLVMLLLGTEGDAQVFTDADCKKELGGLDVSMFKENKLPLWVHGSGDVALTLTVTSKPSSNAKPGMPATVQLTYHSFLGVRVVDSSGAVVTGSRCRSRRTRSRANRHSLRIGSPEMAAFASTGFPPASTRSRCRSSTRRCGEQRPIQCRRRGSSGASWPCRPEDT